MATHGVHRGPRSPLVIDIARLGRRPGSMNTIQETVPSPARMGVELLAIEEGAPLELDLRLQSVSEGVLVTGTVSAPTTGECARCLTPITGDIEVDITELFAYPGSQTEATTENGTPLASAGPDHHHDAIDPRWAKLSTIVPTEQEPDGSGAPS